MDDIVGRDAIHTGVVATETGFITENRTGTARKIGVLNSIGIGLAPTQKSAERVCCAPNTHNTRIAKRGQVHISAVHGNHYVDVAHQGKFFRKSLQNVRYIYAAVIFVGP